MTSSLQAYLGRLIAAAPPVPPELAAELRAIMWDWLGSPPGPLPLPPSGAVPAGRDVGEQVLGLLDIPQAARYLAVSERTARRLVSSGQLKTVRIGRAVRIAPEDLAAFVESLRRDVASPGSPQ